MFDRKFSKSLIMRDFDDVLKNPFRSFPITHYYQNKIRKSQCKTCNRGSKSRRYISKNELFERFGTLQTHNLQIRWLISNFFADFASLHGDWHLVKISDRYLKDWLFYRPVCCTANLEPLLQVLHCDFRKFFLIIPMLSPSLNSHWTKRTRVA